MANLNVGNIGIPIRVTVKEDGSAVDISAATTKDIIMLRPRGTTVTKAAAFNTDGIDGVLLFTSVSGDFDDPGDYTVQVKIVDGAKTWYTSLATFFVADNL